MIRKKSRWLIPSLMLAAVVCLWVFAETVTRTGNSAAPQAAHEDEVLATDQPLDQLAQTQAGASDPGDAPMQGAALAFGLDDEEDDEDDLEVYQRVAATPSAQALAQESLAFLESVEEMILDAAEAGDADALRDEVEMRAFGLKKRWMDQGIEQMMARFEGCSLAIGHAESLASAVRQQPSFKRTQSIKHDTRELERRRELCRREVAG